MINNTNSWNKFSPFKILLLFSFITFSIITIDYIPHFFVNKDFNENYLNISLGDFVELKNNIGNTLQNIKIIQILQINETDSTIQEIEKLEEFNNKYYLENKYNNQNNIESIIEISVRRRLRHGGGHGGGGHGGHSGNNNGNRPHGRTHGCNPAIRNC